MGQQFETKMPENLEFIPNRNYKQQIDRKYSQNSS